MSEHVETAGAARLAIAAQERGPAVFSRLAGCYALEARGADAVEFLHGQLANDVKGLPDGGSSRSLLLNHKGQAMAEAQVLRLEPRRLVLVVDDDMGEWVRETLARHIVFDEVELTPVACEVVTIQGANARGAVEAAGLNVPAAGITVEASGGRRIPCRSPTTPSCSPTCRTACVSPRVSWRWTLPRKGGTWCWTGRSTASAASMAWSPGT